MPTTAVGLHEKDEVDRINEMTEERLEAK